MANPIIKFVNAETGEEIEREMTTDEFAAYEAEVAKAENDVNAENNKKVEKAALLERLGITADEAKLLLS